MITHNKIDKSQVCDIYLILVFILHTFYKSIDSMCANLHDDSICHLQSTI